MDKKCRLIGAVSGALTAFIIMYAVSDSDLAVAVIVGALASIPLYFYLKQQASAIRDFERAPSFKLFLKALLGTRSNKAKVK